MTRSSPDSASSHIVDPNADQDRPASTGIDVDPERWLDEHGNCLFAFAIARTRRRDVAEELVQETLLAALEGRERFAGRSSERTWLLSILRHKLADHYRQARRTERAGGESDAAEQEATSFHTHFFGEQHKWLRSPRRWRADASNFEEREGFWNAFDDCVARLTPRMAEAFCLREFHGMAVRPLSEMLNVTENNLTTLLYRARMLLRECLESNWFGGPDDRPRRKRGHRKP